MSTPWGYHTVRKTEALMACLREKGLITYRTNGRVTWPEGLLGAAMVYPLGESDVETEEIRMRLEKVLSDSEGG